MIVAYSSHSNTFGPIRRERLVKRVRLSSKSGGPWLPKHWTAKREADEVIRLREELEQMERMEMYGYGFYTLS